MLAKKDTDLLDFEDEDDLDEEPGEVIESAPPQKVGEERELNRSGLKKKLLKPGQGWETPGPEFNDEVTVHYVGTLLDGTKFDSTRDRGEPVTFTVGQAQVVAGLDYGIITMKKGEVALFTLPAVSGYEVGNFGGLPPNSIIQFEVELISWITVVDVCKNGGVIKKIMEKGYRNERPSDLDEVLVKYQVALIDGTIVAETSEEGFEFHVKDGHHVPGLSKAIMTMERGEKAKLIVQPQYVFGEKGGEAGSRVHSVPPNSELHVNIELVSFKPVINVTVDSKVLKKILREGEGSVTANEGAAVTISYVAKVEDGTIFEKKGIDETKPLKFITDEEQVIVGLDRAVATMKKGEEAIISIHPDYAFGNVEARCDLATVPSGSNVVYEVEMVDFIKEKAPWELNNSEKIEAAGKKKEEGNLLFKNGKYQRAACSLKLNNFSEAIKLCSQVLNIEFYNVKALYRRAQAYIETGDYILADVDIKQALEADPQNKEVKLLQRKLKQLQLESDKRDAKLYANMFANKERDLSVVTKRMKVEKSKDERKDEEVMRMQVDKVAG